MAKIPFSIYYRPQIESGEYKVETMDGKHVRILCYDANNIMPIVALVTFNDGSEGSYDYYSDGTMDYGGRENPLDLFIVTPEPDRTEFEQELVNFFNGRNTILPDKDGVYNKRDCEEFLHKSANKLLSLAREEFAKEYKGGSEANKKTRSAYCSGYEAGKADAMKDLDGTGKVHCKSYDTGYDDGKKEALKDLPRWKKIGQGNNYSLETEFCINGRYLEMNDTLNSLYEMALKDLEKLPKE